jgi:acetyltransferase-like isoleucine patch superfamily enzyme
MADAKRRFYEKVTGRKTAGGGRIDLSWGDLLAFLWQSGGRARLRGLWCAWRLGACGGRLFVGRRARLAFPRHLRVGRNVFIGDDSYVSAYAREGIRLGDNVRIREGAWIQATSRLDQPGVGLTVGSDTYIGPRSLLGAGGGITIGRGVTFGAGVQLLAENHEFRDPAKTVQEQGVTRFGITVEDDVWIGNNAIVLDGVRIGRGAVIGAAAVVTRDVPPMAVAVGNPARTIGSRGDAAPAPDPVVSSTPSA